MTDRPPIKNIAQDDNLELFFAAERANPTPPNPALLGRILSDANALQPATEAINSPIRNTWWQEIWAGFGGWGAAAALTSCLILGVSLGVAPPQTLGTLAETVLETTGIGTVAAEYLILDDLMVEG